MFVSILFLFGIVIVFIYFQSTQSCAFTVQNDHSLIIERACNRWIVSNTRWNWYAYKVREKNLFINFVHVTSFDIQGRSFEIHTLCDYYLSIVIAIFKFFFLRFLDWAHLSDVDGRDRWHHVLSIRPHPISFA